MKNKKMSLKSLESLSTDSAPYAQIGDLIRDMREKRHMTQQDLAEALGSTQSAMARIETGHQNLTIEQLSKISEILGKTSIEVSIGTIDFRIEGGHKLSGSVNTSTSKNGALGLMVASLVNSGVTTLHDIPRIEEVYRYMEIMQSIGMKVEWIGDRSLKITPLKVYKLNQIDQDVAKKTRSFTFVGALIHISKKFSFPNPGGCKMGARTIASNKYALETFGVDIQTKDQTYDISAPAKLKQNQTVVLYESSDTGAICTLLAASRIPGASTIKFAPPNYQVQDVCFFLEKLGVKIEGIGTTTLRVHGKKDIKANIEHYNSEDPIESMFFISAGIVTKSKLTVKRCPIDFLELEMEKLKRMGLKYDTSKPYVGRNKKTKLVDITIYPSKLVALKDKIHTQPYPGINNDNLPFFVPIAATATGTTLIHDWTWENRAIYFTELNRLGADIKLVDPHRAFVTGPSKFKGTQIVSPPALRPTAIILVAMLAAPGTSILRNVYSINRGYEDIADRLNAIGAKITVIK